MVEPDPWNVIDKNQANTHNCIANNLPNHEVTTNLSTFEDNFSTNDCVGSDKLPDSVEYIQSLGISFFDVEIYSFFFFFIIPFSPFFFLCCIY